MIGLPSTQIEGIITMHKGKDPEQLEQVAKFPNMILNSGLRELLEVSGNDAGASFFRACEIGASGAAVQPDQTGLTNFLRESSGAGQAADSGADTTDPLNPFVWYRKTIRFEPSGSNYTVAEVGFRNSNYQNNNNLINRALLKDAEGQQATLTVLGDEFLDVTYEMRLYPPMQDATGVLTPTGNKGGVERAWKARAGTQSATGDFSFSDSYGWGLRYPLVEHRDRSDERAHARASSDPMPPIFNRIAEYGQVVHEVTTDNTSGNEGTSYIKIPFGLNDYNISIRTIQVPLGCVNYMVEFDPPFEKTEEDKLEITLTHKLSRR